MITGIIYLFSHRSTNLKHHERLSIITERFTSSIKTRMSRYENGLVQLRAHFLTSPNVTRESFQRYVESLTVLDRYPGIQGIGYTVRIPSSQLLSYERKVKKEGFADFKVWPQHPRAEYFSIHYIEPFDWRNKRAFGYDMFTDNIRRQAMIQARDSGKPSVTSLVKLVQETKQAPQPGLLLYVPVYRGVLLPATIAERRESLVGFVYAPFRAKDLFKAILELDPSLVTDIHAEIYDGQPTHENLYFDNDEMLPEPGKKLEPGFVSELIDVQGKTWTIRAQLRLNRSLIIEKATPPFIGLLFALLSFLIFWIVFSSRKHNQLLRGHASALEAAVKTRDEFMSLASHELQTPLTSLLIKTQLMQRRVSKGEVELEKVSDYVNFTRGQIQRLSKLVDNLLDVSRISSGKFKLQKETFDFGMMVKDVIDRILPIFQKEGTPAPQVEIGEELIGEWDLMRIEQVITNLLTNAIRYGEGKPISITVKKNHHELLLAIRDNGRGIAPANLEKIFERFERLVHQNEISGLGLGLYLSRKIVEAHAGRIWAESVPGQGSTFFIQLPLK
jgi:two-component system, OmpR family, sensor kinase